jgi:iron complex outermembrane recepter protein
MKRSVHLSATAGRMFPAIVLAVASALAQAQTQTSAPGSTEGLQEVVVTATKQAAIDVNKVPVSISAYSDKEMDMRGIRTIADLASITPGLVFSQQNNFGTPQTNIEIRGIQSRTSAPTTGIYLDDTPMIGRANNVNTGQDGGYPQVFDLERVEVLRGPQGTLFGHQAAEPYRKQCLRTRIRRRNPLWRSEL